MSLTTNSARRVSASLALRIAGAFAQIVLTWSVARLCVPEQAGAFFFAFSILVVASTFARLGLEVSGLRLVATLSASGDRAGMAAAVGSRVALVLGCGTVVGAGLFFAAPGIVAVSAMAESAVPAVRLAAVGIPVLALMGLVGEMLKGLDRASIAVVLQSLCVPLSATLALVASRGLSGLATAEAALAAIAVAVTAASIGGLLLTARAANFHHVRALVSDLRLCVLRRALQDVPALIVVSTASVAMQWSGPLLLGFFAGPGDVAGYSVAVRLSIAVSVVHSAVAGVIGPRMAVSHDRGDLGALALHAHRTSLTVAALTWPVLLLMLFRPGLVLGLFGVGSAQFGRALQVLLLAQLAAGVIGHSGTALVMSGHYALARRTSIAGVTVLVAASLALVPPYGPLGAAIAMALGVLAGHLTALVLCRRALGLWALPLTPSQLRDAVARPGARERAAQ